MNFRILTFILLLSFGQQTFASLPKTNISEKRQALQSRPAGLISQATHKKMLRVHSYLKNEKYDNAISLLKKIEKSVKSRPSELAQVYQNIGFTYIQKGDEKSAITYLDKALKLKALPYGPTLSTMYTKAQILMGMGKVDAAMATAIDWFAHVESPKPGAYILLASGYAQKGKRKVALEHVEKALGLSNQPKKSWLQFAVALNYELGQYKKAVKYLEVLTAQYPDEKKHWTQLAGLYVTTDQDKKALSAMELTDKWKKLSKESEVLNLVSLYLNRAAPYWGAMALEDGIKRGVVKPSKKSLQLLAQSYLQAEEVDRAFKPLAEAAKLGKDSELYALQGQLYLEKEDWKKALASFKSSLGGAKKGRLGPIHLGIGMAHHSLGEVDQARSAFLVASKHKVTEKAAGQWLSHIGDGQ